MKDQYRALLQFLREVPEDYAGSTAPFWDDGHISGQMLEAHLDPELDAASRRHSFIRRSADWIAELAAPAAGKELLDLGCGPGLYAEAFDAHGFCVTGIDLSRRSIEYAENSARIMGREIQYRCQNYLSVDFGGLYDVVTIIYCDFGVLSPADRVALLKKVRRALKPGGFFLLDAFTPRQYDDFPEGRTISMEESGFWSAEPYACIETRFLRRKAALEQYVVVTEDDCRCYNLWNTIYTPASIEAELRAAGFSEVALYGNVCGEPLSPKSRTLCAVARP